MHKREELRVEELRVEATAETNTTVVGERQPSLPITLCMSMRLSACMVVYVRIDMYRCVDMCMRGLMYECELVYHR